MATLLCSRKAKIKKSKRSIPVAFPIILATLDTWNGRERKNIMLCAHQAFLAQQNASGNKQFVTYVRIFITAHTQPQASRCSLACCLPSALGLGLQGTSTTATWELPAFLAFWETIKSLEVYRVEAKVMLYRPGNGSLWAGMVRSLRT